MGPCRRYGTCTLVGAPPNTVERDPTIIDIGAKAVNLRPMGNQIGADSERVVVAEGSKLLWLPFGNCSMDNMAMVSATDFLYPRNIIGAACYGNICTYPPPPVLSCL